MQVIETERLVLRHFTPEDAAFILELVNEPGWKKYIGDRGIDTVDDARKYIETVPVASYAKHGFGLWAVELKDYGSLVGMCGLVKRDTLDDVDIGFALLSRFEGRGYAQEAANATLAYARDRLGLHRVVAITTDNNDRSRILLERAGMSYEGPISLSGETLRLFAIDL
ncbi:MAG TPA: GNAT family N-acetyltransferase [Pyrinomonadaceae bacterium]